MDDATSGLADSHESLYYRFGDCCGQLKLATALEFFQYRFLIRLVVTHHYIRAVLVRCISNDIVRYCVSCIAEAYIARAGTHSFFRLLKKRSIGLLSHSFHADSYSA